jgi:uncharacterized protein
MKDSRKDRSASMQYLPAAARPAQPWKNGQGDTYQVAAWPADSGSADFDWRISIAEIAADSAFSSFPGVDRTIAVIGGNGLELMVDNDKHELKPFEPYSFSGDSAVSSRLLNGPTHDLNLMTKRGAAAGSMHFIAISQQGLTIPVTDTETVVVLGIAGRVRIDDRPFVVGPQDGFLLSGPAETRITATDGLVAVIRLKPWLSGRAHQ